MRLLAASDKTAKQLTDRLTAKGYDEKDARAAVEKLRRQGYLNELSFAEKTVMRLYESCYGKEYVRAYLRDKGFCGEALDRAESVMDGLDFDASAKRYLKFLAGSGKTRAQALSALYKRGFTDVSEFDFT